ncbi:MAG: endolytic transglycosylase MltG [Candidatus Cloacimonetes bacterium]|nr:endolytic transglycosylase MltG [Candidatus Cloacimonadota bacterium]
MKFFSLILLLIVFIFIIYSVFLFFKPFWVRQTVIEIENGESALSIATKLFYHDVIKSKFAFYVYVKITGISGRLSYGKYLFNGRYSLLDVIRKIKSGEVYLRRVTIPEGYTINKTSQRLARKGFGDYEAFRALANDSTFARKLTGFSIPSLEGFLYPETYYFPEDVNEEYILTHMVRRFFVETADLDFAPNANVDFYQTIILASIVEKEAHYNDEKPLIASVYLNRIEGSMRLQADPTVAYVLEKYGQNRKIIYYRDLTIDSPYNTYKYLGLPPTPICNPSLSSIEAVLNPINSDFYFFFADRKGRHIFSQTYSQHLTAQRNLKGKHGK